MKSLTFSIILLCIGLSTNASTHDPIVVVVNHNNPVNTMTQSEVIDLFMGKYVAFPNGKKAIPVELDGEQVTKQVFYKSLVGMSLARINAYWSRIHYTGRTRSAIQQPNEEKVIQFLNNTDLAIGYIPFSKINNNLKVVFKLNE